MKTVAEVFESIKVKQEPKTARKSHKEKKTEEIEKEKLREEAFQNFLTQIEFKKPKSRRVITEERREVLREQLKRGKAKSLETRRNKKGVEAQKKKEKEDEEIKRTEIKETEKKQKDAKYNDLLTKISELSEQVKQSQPKKEKEKEVEKGDNDDFILFPSKPKPKQEAPPPPQPQPPPPPAILKYYAPPSVYKSRF